MAIPLISRASRAPRFVYQSPVFFDELDAMGMLHNSRVLVHVERATASFHDRIGHGWFLDPADNPDQVHVVRQTRVEYLAPVRQPTTLHVELWTVRLGATSCTYGFRLTDVAGEHTYAEGDRTIVKVGVVSLRPEPWSDSFRSGHARFAEEPG